MEQRRVRRDQPQASPDRNRQCMRTPDRAAATRLCQLLLFFRSFGRLRFQDNPQWLRRLVLRGLGLRGWVTTYRGLWKCGQFQPAVMHQDDWRIRDVTQAVNSPLPQAPVRHQREMDPRPPSSSGSAGVSPELIQAEVSRQLESMMSEVKGQLQEERMRTQDALMEARFLRQQLDFLFHWLMALEFLQEFPRVILYLVLWYKSGRADRPETVKPGITQLPMLPEYRPATGSIDLLNWLTHIEPIMQDLSDTSSSWWRATLQDAATWYAQYSAAPPLLRLQLKPIASTGHDRPEWTRVERRATAMILSAIPGTVKDEAISAGTITTLTLLCKLYTVYQPGNLQEKALILQQLERPEPCASAHAAVEGLRKWTLWRRRVEAVGIAEPDASVLVQGLDQITSQVVKGNSELSFRVSLIRSSLQVDVCPTVDSVTSFSQHLQAEMEQQARLGAVMTPPAVSLKAITSTSSPDAGEASGVAGTGGSPPARPNNGLCRFFAGDKGCRRGNTCRYPHTWNLLEKGGRSKKCLACGSTQHKVKDCKAPGGSQSPSRTNKGQVTGPGETGSTSPTATVESSARRVTFDGEQIQAKVLQTLNDVRFLPMVRSVVSKVCGWATRRTPPSPRSRSALLDSGATHVLRGPRDDGEWEAAREVRVQLAGDSSTSMKQTQEGTLLNEDQMAQIIVPLGKVITHLGFRLHWTAEECYLEGEDGEVINLDVVRGCPEVSEEVAQTLIARLEQSQLPELVSSTEASVRALGAVKTSWRACLMEYVVSGNMESGRAAVDKASFLMYREEVKEALIVKRSTKGVWDILKGINVNRRSRKRLLRSPSWVVRWDPPSVDRQRDDLKHLGGAEESIYLNVNTLLVDNEFQDVWRVLLWGATSGKITTVVARDCQGTSLDQVVAAPHRDKVHLLHALSTAGRTVRGQGQVRLLVEDWDRVQRTDQNPDDDIWPAWSRCVDAREYVKEMGIMDISISRFTGKRYARLARMDGDAAWRLHVMRGHQPFRRDCSVCVRNSATGKQHRATMHPMAYSLSVDVVGPLKEYGKSPDGKFFKYFVIGALRIPKIEGGEGHPEVRGHPIPPEGDPECPDEDVLSEEEVDEDESKAPLETSTLYFAVPVNNKKAATMLPAVQKIVLDVKALGYPVTRLHSDRGGEFRGHLVRRWALSQGMWPTTTSGSESAANGVAESGVRYLKRRARVLMDSAGVPKCNWPTAIQYAATQQRYDALGMMSPMPFAYGARVYVKTKKYKTGAVEDFGPHWTHGRYVGPSTDVRGGHLIVKESGTFVQTTHVRVTTDPPPLDKVAPSIIVEAEGEKKDEPVGAEPPLPPPHEPPPRTRMRSKMPRAAKVGELYELFPGLSEIQNDIKGSDEEEAVMKYLRPEEIEYVELVAKDLFVKEKFTAEDSAHLLGLFAGTCGNLKVPRAPEGQGMVMGAFVHGGSFGVTRYGRDLPWTTKYFNVYMMKKILDRWPGTRPTWSALVIQGSDQVPRHRDVHNERATFNYVLELKSEAVNGLWVENKGDERCVVGGECPVDYQYETPDGAVHEGCLVDVTESPAAFDPRIPHAYVQTGGKRWFLSAYTPQGVSRLSALDKEYLNNLNFPQRRDEVDDHHGVLETTPALRTASFPSEDTLSGSRVSMQDVEPVTIGDCEATLCDWGFYVEDTVEEEYAPHQYRQVSCLRQVCSSDDPGVELNGLVQSIQELVEEEVGPKITDEMLDNMEHWSSMGLFDVPRICKVEPEYTPDIEDLINAATRQRIPLRHTYNVSPSEARSSIERWRSSIIKELGVVEKGFQRIKTSDLSQLKVSHTVQELPSKLVFTVKPPASSTAQPQQDNEDDESHYCKRKSRIVCCGNFASDEGYDLFAGGVAAESLRCVLVFTAGEGWMIGTVDVTGAFMLTPLSRAEGQTLYVIRPPAALIQLGLADKDERWLLTHGMYGLRQSPRLWSEYRDSELKQMTIECNDKSWYMKPGIAEPNVWMVYEVGVPVEQGPAGLVLLYVDDIMLAGPHDLVLAMSSSIGRLWKTSELDLLTPGRDLRFLGCEISVSDDGRVFYIHQRPYIEEVLRHHAIPDTTLSYVQAPREMVTFEAFEDEAQGTEEQVKAAQRLCGELLWLAQRSRPDISYVVSAMGSLLSRAAARCTAIGMRLLAYLQQTKHLSLAMRATSDELIAFSDSSFAPQGTRSFTGAVLSWRGSPVSWRAAKQPFTCLSTAECELVASIEALTMAKSLEAVIPLAGPSGTPHCAWYRQPSRDIYRATFVYGVMENEALEGEGFLCS
ncbi:unnamed protein product [Symbiodinium sp. CCMP2592]|nr:unnamed protein product [Symbiodinium sp. CCMP2592]